MIRVIILDQWTDRHKFHIPPPHTLTHTHIIPTETTNAKGPLRCGDHAGANLATVPVRDRLYMRVNRANEATN